MKAIELQLISGRWAVFFLSTNFLINERLIDYKGEQRMVAVLQDGIHNNGGWELADSYSEVKSRLFKLFDLEGIM